MVLPQYDLNTTLKSASIQTKIPNMNAEKKKQGIRVYLVAWISASRPGTFSLSLLRMPSMTWSVK
jgi:hypothetical protein